MMQEAQKQLVDALLTTYQLLEQEQTKLALDCDESLNTTKGIIARLVITISNVKEESK